MYSNSLRSSHCRHHGVTACTRAKWFCVFNVPHFIQRSCCCNSSGVFGATRWAVAQAEHETQWPGRTHMANTSSGRIGFAPNPAAGYVLAHAKQSHVWPSDFRFSRASSLFSFKTLYSAAASVSVYVVSVGTGVRDVGYRATAGFLAGQERVAGSAAARFATSASTASTSARPACCPHFARNNFMRQCGPGGGPC